MNCTNCGAPLRLAPGLDYLQCEYCTSIFFPEEPEDGVQVLGEDSAADCPVCQTPLVSASIHGTQVLHCTRCRGVLVRQFALLPIIQYLRSRLDAPPPLPRPLDREALRRQVACPYCRQVMDTHPYYGPGNVVVDSCIECGVVWLDYNELGRIAGASRRDFGQWE